MLLPTVKIQRRATQQNANCALSNLVANSTAQKTEHLARTAHLVDRECQRLGYEAIVRQRCSGVEFVSVPALIRNCSSLLALLATGGSNEGCRSRSLPNTKSQQLVPIQLEQGPKSESELHLQTQDSSCRSGLEAGCAGNGAAAIISTNSNHGKRRGSGWMKFFHGIRSSHKTAITAAVVVAEKAATVDLTCEKAAVTVEMSPIKIPDRSAIKLEAEQSGWERRQEGSCLLYLQHLLEDVHQKSERLLTIAGQESDEDSEESGSLRMPPLTELQREVYYFQTRWPRIVQTLSDKLTEVARTSKRMQQEAAAKAKAETCAKARSFAKMASMEAELRRLRSESRKCFECRTLLPQQKKRLAASNRAMQQRKRCTPAVENSATIATADGDGKV